MRIGGKAQAAVGFGNDHAQEALALQVVPDIGGQVEAFLRDLPVIDHAAGFFGLVVQEALFIVGQARARIGVQAAPVGTAAEQLAFPPYGAGLERVALGVGHLRQHLRYMLKIGADSTARRKDAAPAGPRPEAPRRAAQEGSGAFSCLLSQCSARCRGNRMAAAAAARASPEQEAHQARQQQFGIVGLFGFVDDPAGDRAQQVRADDGVDVAPSMN